MLSQPEFAYHSVIELHSICDDTAMIGIAQILSSTRFPTTRAML